jgi:ABC-type dipeptide/oligopeptide/nickel transport system permease component
LLCLPPAITALAFVWFDVVAPALALVLVLALAVFPRVYRYARQILEQAAQAPHVCIARARGAGAWRIAATHIALPQLPAILAAGAVSTGIGFAAAVPAEVVCDWPGLGHLAWQAALGRDLDLLVWITLAITAVSATASTAADWLGGQP